MKLKCAVGSVVLTMVLVSSFCWRGVFFWLHRRRMPTITITEPYNYNSTKLIEVEVKASNNKFKTRPLVASPSSGS